MYEKNESKMALYQHLCEESANSVVEFLNEIKELKRKFNLKKAPWYLTSLRIDSVAMKKLLN